MESQQFIEYISEWFESWFKSIKTEIDSGDLKISGQYSFPSLLRIGESPDHYVVELTGAQNIDDSSKYRLQKPTKTEKVENAAFFLNPGGQTMDGARALMTITSEGNIFKHLTFATQFDQQEFERKINISLNSSRIQAVFDAQIPLSITETADKLVFRDIDLIRMNGPEIFFRRISTAIVLKKNTNKEELYLWLNYTAQLMKQAPFSDVLGINLDYSVSEEGFAMQLLSLTQQNIDEGIIDTFIQGNASFFASALGYKKALSQKKLKVINKEGLDKEFLQPDYLMLRDDGNYDILDLKKALIKSRSITVGEQSRIRFSAYATELIGQLEGYKRYFSNQENREWAKRNLGITIGEKLNLLGVVGNHNNFERDQVDMASKVYRENIIILSYSEIIDLLRKS